MLFVSIVWNYFKDFPVEICRYLNNYSPIKKVTLLNPGRYFEKFIEDVYSFDKIRKEYLSHKLTSLKKLPNKNVLIIVHEFSEPELYYDSVSKICFSKKSKILKEKIRDKFNVEFNCFEKEPIIHTTDNEIETLELMKILQQYYKTCDSKTIKSSTWHM